MKAGEDYAVAARGLSRALAALLIVLASCVLVGWRFDLALLKSAAPGYVAMNPLTALNFGALGAGLLSARLAAGATLARGLGLVVATVTALKLLEVATGVPFAVDQWLFSAELAPELGRPANRMAPNTAVGQLMLGTSLALLGVRTGRVYLSELLALAAALPGFFALVGYGYGVRSFYRVGPFIPMAVHTAAALLLCVASLLFARAEHATAGLLCCATLAGAMMRKLVPAALFAPVFVGWLRLEGQRFGLYPTEVGAALFAVILTLLLLVIVYFTARSLERVDRLRIRATEQLEEVAHRLARSNEELEKLASVDGLTGVLNRRAWMAGLDTEFARAARYKTPLSVLMIDADHFKGLNDRYGHSVGDRALRDMAQLFVSELRSIDVVGRYGGEEFCVMLPNTPLAGASLVAERMRHALHALTFYASANESVALRCSIGVAAFVDALEGPADLLRAADIALYEAKTERDCVRCAS